MATSEQALRTVDMAGRSREWLLLGGLITVFVISGASGLIYQVVWVRQLALVFGVTAYAISTVLSSFFAGLALGSFLAGRVADRLRSPLRAYVIAEVLVAVAGLLTPVAFLLARAVYVRVADALPGGLWPLTLVRFLLAFLCLLVPTTLMGATLPLIVRSSLARGERVARNLSLLYAANTFGAMAGTFLTGFYFIGRYGLQNALFIAVACNLIAAAGAFVLERGIRNTVRVPPATETGEDRPASLRKREQPHRNAGKDASLRPDTDTHPHPHPHPHPADASPPVPPHTARVSRTALWVFGVSGAVSLAYEVVWARVLSMFFDASTYGFTAMLTMVLLGIGLGSWLISPVIARNWNWALVLAGIEAGVGVLGLLAVPLLVRLIPIGEWLGLYHDPGPLGQFGVKFMAFAAFLIVFPPMLLLGASFPVAARVVGTEGAIGRKVGGVYAVNVFGGIIGALIGGFGLVPYLGAQRSLLLLAWVNLGLALVMLWPVVSRRLLAACGTGGLALAVLGAVTAPDLLSGIFTHRFVGQDVVWVDEGMENTVAVTDYRETGERKMYLNGQPQASTWGFIAGYHQFIGHLPMLLHPDPKRALVIGLGGGATPGALSLHTGVEVEIVELSEAVVDAAPLFRLVNHDVLLRPNVRMHVDDGRNYLLLTNQKYDVITADIIRPTHAGATNLYSKEYYKLVKEHLTDGGIMVQWLEQLSEEHYKILMRSFVEVFPYVTVWAEGSVLVGSNHPQLLACATLERRMQDAGARTNLVLLSLSEPELLLRLYMGNRDEALRYLEGEKRAVTDNRPYVEFHRTLGERRAPDVSSFSRDARQLFGGQQVPCLP